MTRKLIIDTDPGVDDAMAIFMALASSELDVVGLTTIFGNAATVDTTRNARRLLDAAGRDDIPVAAGADAPLVAAYIGPVPWVHGHNGLGDAPLNELTSTESSCTIRRPLPIYSTPMRSRRSSGRYASRRRVSVAARHGRTWATPTTPHRPRGEVAHRSMCVLASTRRGCCVCSKIASRGSRASSEFEAGNPKPRGFQLGRRWQWLLATKELRKPVLANPIDDASGERLAPLNLFLRELQPQQALDELVVW